ncbi:LysM peptidoglycan-binding domain-containing protein [Ornithinibacillus halotolerans]|uniref:Spore germination protein YaaH n=1 Tax=Ornithinibacillus halotolerans TaxID=1274357 RepID=A0A916W916_9BACI|nr:LysM peptidoglycan-binding domain-containing protein [Ornithinibacillus halotolerans]GGA77900.1 spore germination protein YaaH [Ornithinibacillus halotolerans]
MQIHVVSQGETLWQVAELYQSNVNQIVYLNQLDNPNVLVVGQSLVIPDPNVEYVVQPGDNLWKVASKLNVSIQELQQFNNLSNPNLIFTGELIALPYRIHTIQMGEYLWMIAQRYNVTINEILQANQLESPSLIYPGQPLRIPRTPSTTIDVNAYTTQTTEEGRQEVLALGRYFTYLSPFMYSYRADGSLTELNENVLLEVANLNEVSSLLVLTNYSGNRFDSDLGAALLRNESMQNRLIENVLKKIYSKGYSGLNIDFEYLYPEDRENYNNFLRKVVNRLKPQGLTVSTALAPKESEDQTGLLYEAHDYEVHGELCDFVILMTYEWGWAGGEPWAIAPINKVRDILDYAITAIPRNKIMMGMPLYGRDWKIPWVQGTFAKTVSPKEAVTLAAQNNVNISYDETYQSPYYRYIDNSGQEHEVWFEDARSVQVKYDTVKEYGLRGVSYWVLGNPFPQNWPILQVNFNIRKE